MNSDELQALQAPLKQRYRDQPEAAICELTAVGSIDFATLTCRIHSSEADQSQAAGAVAKADRPAVAGLHSMAGGDGVAACSGDMLLQSLVACSGVTLAAVATAMGLDVRSAKVCATGRMDFRGTLAVDRETPVGLTDIRLRFELASSEDDQKLDKLIQLTERYCVVLQTLVSGVAVCCERVAAE